MHNSRLWLGMVTWSCWSARKWIWQDYKLSLRTLVLHIYGDGCLNIHHSMHITLPLQELMWHCIHRIIPCSWSVAYVICVELLQNVKRLQIKAQVHESVSLDELGVVDPQDCRRMDMIRLWISLMALLEIHVKWVGSFFFFFITQCTQISHYRRCGNVLM